jgi:hypothetical protein
MNNELTKTMQGDHKMKKLKNTTASRASGKKAATKDSRTSGNRYPAGFYSESSNLRTLAVLVSVFALFLITTMAEAAQYRLELRNALRTSPSSLEFSIFLENAGGEGSEFNYSLGQYFLEFNPSIANGGRLTYHILYSDLPSELAPRNPSVSGNQLRLCCNAVPIDRNSLPLISFGRNPLLIARMKIETSASELSNDNPEIRWSGSSSKFTTKIFALIKGKHVDITNKDEHFSEIDGQAGNSAVNSYSPSAYSLEQNYPNPFNPETRIRFSLPVSGHVSLKIYDIAGREIVTLVDEIRIAGSYETRFSASNLSSGVYFYRIIAGKFRETMRMIVLK